MLRGINLRGGQGIVTFRVHPFSKLVKGVRHGTAFEILLYTHTHVSLYLNISISIKSAVTRSIRII